MDNAAGTPEPVKDDSGNAGTPEPVGEGSGLNAQQQSEWLALKVKAEQVNEATRKVAEKDAEIARLTALAYGRGAQATDPDAETIQTLKEQEAFDPQSRGVLMGLRSAARAEAEAFLATNLTFVPEGKREKVRDLIRATGYKASVQQALESLDDPAMREKETKIASLEAEVNRLKKQTTPEVQRSPAATPPADADAGAGESLKDIPRSEYIAILNAGGQRATELMKAVASNKTKLTDS